MKQLVLFLLISIIASIGWAAPLSKKDLRAVLAKDMGLTIQQNDINSISNLKNRLKTEELIHYGIYKTSNSVKSFLWITYNDRDSNKGIFAIANDKMKLIYLNTNAGKFKEARIKEYFGKKNQALDITFERIGSSGEPWVISEIFVDLLGNGLSHVYSYIKDDSLVKGGNYGKAFNELFEICPKCVVKCTTGFENSSTNPELLRIFSITKIDVGVIPDQNMIPRFKKIVNDLLGIDYPSLSSTVLKDQIELSGESPNLFMAYGVGYPGMESPNLLAKGCPGGFVPGEKDNFHFPWETHLKERIYSKKSPSLTNDRGT